MKSPSNKTNWYQRWFSGNNVLNALIMALLVLLIIFMIYQIRFIIEPMRALFTAVGAPIIIAGVLYYLLIPVVNWLNTHTKMPKKFSVGLVLVAVLAILALIVTIAVTIISDQVSGLVDNWPNYWQNSQRVINDTFATSEFQTVREWLSNTNSDINQTVADWSRKYLQSGVSGIGQIASTLTTVGVTLVASPFILFYMLLDGNKLSSFIADKLPSKAQTSLQSVLQEVSKQVAQYIRGQLGVALAVIIMFSIGYTIIGLPYGILLAFMAGLFNMIPYVGSILAQVPIFIVALVAGGPKLVLFALIVLVIEQPIEGHVIAPKILGSALKIHPVTVIVVLLTGGHIFGVLGIILSVPTYAVVKVLVTHIYEWWRTNSDLFAEDAHATTSEMDNSVKKLEGNTKES